MEDTKKVVIDKPDWTNSNEKKKEMTLEDYKEENEVFRKQILLQSLLLKNQVSLNFKSTAELIQEDLETLEHFDFSLNEDKEKERELRIYSGNQVLKNMEILINDVCKFKSTTLTFLEDNKKYYEELEE